MKTGNYGIIIIVAVFVVGAGIFGLVAALSRQGTFASMTEPGTHQPSR